MRFAVIVTIIHVLAKAKGFVNNMVTVVHVNDPYVPIAHVQQHLTRTFTDWLVENMFVKDILKFLTNTVVGDCLKRHSIRQIHV